MRLSFMPMICRAPDGDAPADPNPAPAAADPAPAPAQSPAPGLLSARAAQPPADAPPADPAPDDPNKPAAATRPDWLPENFWDGKTNAPNIEALAKAFKDTKSDYDRLKAAGSSKAPAKPEDYTFELKDIDHVKAPSSDDPGLQLWRGIAHKHGLTQAQAQGIAAEMMAGAVEFVPQPLNLEAERESLGKNGQAMIDGVYHWAQGLKTRGILNDGEEAELLDLGKSAKGIRVLAKLRELSGEQPFAMTHVIGDGELPTPEEWQIKFGEAVAKGDHAAIAKLEKQGAQLFGTDPSGSSQRNLGVAPRQPAA